MSALKTKIQGQAPVAGRITSSGTETESDGDSNLRVRLSVSVNIEESDKASHFKFNDN